MGSDYCDPMQLFATRSTPSPNGLFGSAPKPSKPSAPLFGDKPSSGPTPLFGQAPSVEPPNLFPPDAVGLGAEVGASTPVVQPPVSELGDVGLTSAQQAVLATLPGPAAAAFQFVYSSVQESPRLRSELGTLLEKHTFDNTVDNTFDSESGQKSAIERLREVADTPRGPGIDGPHLLEQAIEMLYDPDHSIFQGDRQTCGASNVQRQLVQDPEKFCATLESLSSPCGFREGAVLSRAEGSQYEDNSGRSQINRLFQGAIMAKAGQARGDYDPQSDKFADQSQGLGLLDIANVTAQLTGEKQAVVVHDSGTHAEFERIFRQAERSFQVGALWKVPCMQEIPGTGVKIPGFKDSDHMLLCLSQDANQAFFFDPASAKSDQLAADRLMFKAQAAIFPESSLQDAQLPPDAVYWSQPPTPQELKPTDEKKAQETT